MVLIIMLNAVAVQNENDSPCRCMIKDRELLIFSSLNNGLFLMASPFFGLYHHDHSGSDGFVSAGVEPRNLLVKLFQKILRDVDQNPPYVLSHLLHPSFTANRRDEQW